MTPKGLWSLCQHVRSQQASKVVFMIKSSISHFYDLSPSTLLKLFASKVLPILHYGCEIWGFHEAKAVEQIHTNYCKYVLGVRKNVANIAVTSEFGRVNLRTLLINKYCEIFWLKLLCMNDNRIAKKAYIVQYNWAENNTSCLGTKCKKTVVILWFWRSLVFSKCW